MNENNILSRREIDIYSRVLRHAILKKLSACGYLGDSFDSPTKTLNPPNDFSTIREKDLIREKNNDDKLYSDKPKGNRAVARISNSKRRISPEDVEDLIQDGLLRLVKRKKKGMEKHWLKNYVTKIGINLAVDHMREFKKRRRDVDIDSVSIAVESISLSEINEGINMSNSMASNYFEIPKSTYIDCIKELFDLAA